MDTEDVILQQFWRPALGEFHRRIAAEAVFAPVAWLASKRPEKPHDAIKWQQYMCPMNFCQISCVHTEFLCWLSRSSMYSVLFNMGQ